MVNALGGSRAFIAAATSGCAELRKASYSARISLSSFISSSSVGEAPPATWKHDHQ